MAMPKVLKNFNVFNDGQTYIGTVEKIKLPDLKRKTEDLRAGGMNGPVKIDMGSDGLSCEHEYAGFVSQVFSQWAIAKIDGVLLRFAMYRRAPPPGDFLIPPTLFNVSLEAHAHWRGGGGSPPGQWRRWQRLPWRLQRLPLVAAEVLPLPLPLLLPPCRPPPCPPAPRCCCACTTP